MKKSVFMMLVGIMMLAGCGLGNYEVNKTMLDRGLFNTSQAPEFFLELKPGMDYVNHIVYRYHTAGLDMSHHNYYFINKDKKYAVIVYMASMTTGEWRTGAYTPWKYQLQDEVHGNATFSCGYSWGRYALPKAEKPMWEKMGLYNKWVNYTRKDCLLMPGGLSHGHHIEVRYYELGNKVAHDKIGEFLTRAKNRVDFWVEKQ